MAYELFQQQDQKTVPPFFLMQKETLIQIDVEEIKGNVKIVTENVVLTATSPLHSGALALFYVLPNSCK